MAGQLKLERTTLLWQLVRRISGKVRVGGRRRQLRCENESSWRTSQDLANSRTLLSQGWTVSTRRATLGVTGAVTQWLGPEWIRRTWALSLKEKSITH